MIVRKQRAVIFPILALVTASLSCRFSAAEQPLSTEPPADSTATESAISIYPEEPLTVSEPGGAELTVAPGALSEQAVVTLEEVGEGVPFASGSPLMPASMEYELDFGDAEQTGQIIMTIPLSGGGKVSQSGPAQTYLVWAEPFEGTPSVVGAAVEGNAVKLPVIGPGKYQVHSLFASSVLQELFSIYDPLTVPTYPQRTPAWCSPTAMTDLVNYHQGTWPVGGFGAVWGESSNWYLAGKAGQPFNSGYFFHWLLGAGGYTVPSDVKQSFSNGNAEVIIWNWNAALFQHLNPFEPNFGIYTDYSFADELFDAFQAYVEYHVWGAGGDRRPVAWGSSLAGHSRVITGSDGTEYFYNDPGSGSLNSSKAWAAYRQEVMDSFSGPKIEVIDTVVLFAPPRPLTQRRGVVWLTPSQSNGFAGSVALIDGTNGMPATNWVWDGDLGHENGYYYEDLRNVLPADPVFDVQFEAIDFQDEVEYGFSVYNISKATRDFHVDVILQNENLSVLKNVGMFDMSVPAESRVNMDPVERFDLFGLPPGLYTLKYVLLQNGLYQDVKYVQFRVAESELLAVDIHVILVRPSFCRKGPDPVFEDVTAFEEGTELTLMGFNPERTWGKFERMINDISVQCWVSLTSTDLTGEEPVPVLFPPPLPTESPTEESEGPVCESTLDRTACNEAGGTFITGARTLCQCPE